MHVKFVDSQIDSDGEVQVELTSETEVFWVRREDIEKMAAAFGLVVVAA